MAIGDSSSPLHGQKPEEIITGNGRIYLKNNTGKGETLIAVLSRNNVTKVEAEAKTNVSTRPSQPQPAPAGSPEAKIEEESKTNMAVQEDQDTDRKPYAFHSFGAQFAKVLVDPDLGTIKVEKIVGVMDIGKVMNLKTAINQIKGGMIFGMGMALMENVQYDPNNGRIVTRDLAQYLVPVHADIPKIEVQFIDQPDTLYFPARCEEVLVRSGLQEWQRPSPMAIYNATGKRVRDLPITPDKMIA